MATCSHGQTQEAATTIAKRSEKDSERERAKKETWTLAHAAPAPTLNAKHFNYVMIIFQYIFFHIKENAAP